MIFYQWKGVSKSGEIIQKEEFIEDVEEFKKKLKDKEINLLYLKVLESKELKKQKKEQIEIKNKLKSRNEKLLQKKGLSKNDKSIELELEKYLKNKVSKKELYLYTKQIYSMVKSSIGIVDIFALLKEQTENKTLKIISYKIHSDLEQGIPLSEAFEKHRQFDKIYISMLKSGEVSGKLEIFLDRLNNFILKELELQKTIKKALFYPSILIFVTTIVLVIMFIYVVPVFNQMYSSSGKSLPLLTQTIINISDFLKDYKKGGFLFVFCISLILTHFYMLKKSFNYRYWFHSFLFRLPLLKDLILKSSIGKISLVMGNLLGASVSLPNVLQILMSVIQNEVLKKTILNINQGVLNGEKLSSLFSKEEIYPKQFEIMLKIGEETGNIEEMLNSISIYYEEEVKTTVERLTGLIEPFFLIVIGIIVGFILVAMYLPIFSIGTTL